MRCWIFGAAIVAAMASLPAAAQLNSAISIKDPAAFVTQLREMGYKPEAMKTEKGAPQVDIEIDGFGATLRMVGCTEGRDCKYITLAATYSDIISPPKEWIARLNDQFDLVRVGTNEDGTLYMFAAHVVEGLPRAQFERIMNFYAADTSDIGQEANDKGYAAKKK